MLTRARSLFSRVFLFDPPTSQIRLDGPFDNIDDDSSEDDDVDNTIENSTTRSDDNDNDSSDSDDESAQSSTKGKYERQINEYSNRSTKSNLHYTRSHEKSKQNRLISAMQIATSRCNVESMKRLLNNVDIDINHRDQYGMSYLEHAILIGSFDMVDLLVRYGCDLYQGDSNGHSYLYATIETTTNKSLSIIRLLLESNCSCLRLMDIVSLISPTQLIYINSQDYLLLNAHLLLIFKYQIRRMVLTDVLNLINYLIITNLILCKNNEYYGLSSSTKIALTRFNNDYISLFVKTLGPKHAFKLEQQLQNLQTLPSSLISLTIDDIQPYMNQIAVVSKQVPELRHLCRMLIRRNLKNFKSSTITSLVTTVKLQDYLLYTPI